MSLKFHHVSTSLLREIIAGGELSEVEYGLLKKYGDKLRWGTQEKALLLEMATDIFIAKTPQMEVEVRIRSLCHSRLVTADYVSRSDRFSLKRCLLVLGEVGEVQTSWAELVQPALHLFARDFNVIWMEVPSFSTNSSRWMRYGPGILLAGLKELRVDSVQVLACGVGGSLFLETFTQSPRHFGATHFIYNMDLPKGSKVVPFSVQDLEDIMRESHVQIWFAYNDEADVYDRTDWGTPLKAYEAVTKLQARLEGERRRGLRELAYDEILVTEALNGEPNRPNPVQNVKRISIGRDVLLAFSEAFLQATGRFFERPPRTYQDDLEGGLIPEIRRSKSKPLGVLTDPEGLRELPALRKLRLGPHQPERAAIADGNRRRMERLQAATRALLPQQRAAIGDSNHRGMEHLSLPSSKQSALLPPAGELRALPALGLSSSSPALAMTSNRGPSAPDEEEEEDERIFGEEARESMDYSRHRGVPIHKTYHEMWQSLRRGDFS